MNKLDLIYMVFHVVCINRSTHAFKRHSYHTKYRGPVLSRMSQHHVDSYWTCCVWKSTGIWWNMKYILTGWPNSFDVHLDFQSAHLIHLSSLKLWSSYRNLLRSDMTKLAFTDRDVAPAVVLNHLPCHIAADPSCLKTLKWLLSFTFRLSVANPVLHCTYVWHDVRH